MPAAGALLGFFTIEGQFLRIFARQSKCLAVGSADLELPLASSSQLVGICVSDNPPTLKKNRQQKFWSALNLPQVTTATNVDLNACSVKCDAKTQ